MPENSQLPMAASSVFVMADGKAHKHEVEVGVADDTYVAITKGVDVGVQVITGPARVLPDR